MLIKETPRKRLRVPPISATIVDEWYRSSSFLTEVYLVGMYMNQVYVPEPAIPGLSNHSKDIVGRLERCWDATPVELVGQVTARFATAGQVSDHLKFFICHLKVHSFKLPF